MDFDKDMLTYYNRGREQERLTVGLSQIEYLRTLDVLNRYLPAAPAIIYDIGSGPGRYALELVKEGYELHLLDPVELHIQQASEALKDFKGATFTQGDARQLPYRDVSAHVVLLLGPLYHLQDKDDRLNVLREAARVLKKGGLLFAAAISRFAPLSLAFESLETSKADEAIPYLDTDILVSGKHNNPENLEGNFTTAYFHHPDEVDLEIKAAGFTLEKVIALEGVAGITRDACALLDNQEKLEKVLDLLRKLETEKNLMGVSPHILAVAKKPG